MSPTPSPPEPANDAGPTQASQRDEDAQYYRQILHELVEIGADLARTLHRQATTQSAAPEQAGQPAPAPIAAPDPSIAFDRIARTIRRTIALARTLTDPAQPRPAQGTHQRRLAARKQIIRAVEDTVQRRTKDTEAEALHAEFYERLDDPDLDDDIDTLPVADLIKAICRDLGIEHHPGTHPWKRRTPQDVRALCVRAAQPTPAQPRTTYPSTTQLRPGEPRPIPALRPRARPDTGPPGL